MSETIAPDPMDVNGAFNNLSYERVPPLWSTDTKTPDDNQMLQTWSGTNADVNSTTTSGGSLLSNTSGGRHSNGLFTDLLLQNVSDILHTSLHLASSKMTSTPMSMTSLPVEATAESSLAVSGTQLLWPSDNDDNLHDGSGSSLTYGLDDEYSLHIEASKQLWDLVQQDETVVLVVFLSIVTCVGIVAVVVSKIILRRRHQYQLIPNMDPTQRFNYIYRPIHGNAALDDEYENTFVGVSIPILQDNTRI